MDMMERWRAIAGQSLAIDVTWNQLAQPMETGKWVPYNASNVSVTFADGVATVTNIVGGAGDGQALRQATGYGYRRYRGELFFAGVMVKTTFNGAYSVELSGSTDRDYPVTAIAGEWSRYGRIAVASEDRDRDEAYAFLPEFIHRQGPGTGQTEQIKCPVIINLTAMFGAGKEPLAQEFERQCLMNGVDLTQPIPYNAGEPRKWRIK